MQRRNTNQKQIVIESLSALGHSDSDGLIKYINTHYEEISLATIYRNLNILQQEKKIKKVKVGNLDVYETVKEKHYHLVCTKCGYIKDIHGDNVSPVTVNGVNDLITDYDVVFYGICSNCNTNDIKEENKNEEVCM